MDQNTKRIGLINCVVLLGATIGMLLVTRYASTAAGVMGTVLTGVRPAGGAVELFPHGPAGAGAVREDGNGGIEQIARQRIAFCHGRRATPFRPNGRGNNSSGFSAPSFTALLFLLQAAGAYWPWQKLAPMPPIIADRATLAMALLGLMGLILFLLGKYSSGLARLQGQKLCGRARPTCC